MLSLVSHELAFKSLSHKDIVCSNFNHLLWDSKEI